MAGSFLAAVSLLVPAVSHAQPLGSFTWQLQPFCNRVTVNVRQDGAVYTLDGYDDQCGAAQRAAIVGLAMPNPDGTIGFGLNVVTPAGQPVSIEARITLASLSVAGGEPGGRAEPRDDGVPGGAGPAEHRAGRDGGVRGHHRIGRRRHHGCCRGNGPHRRRHGR